MNIDSETIIFTTHAIERFRDRVRPGLSFADAEVELARLAPAGQVVSESPDWHARRAAQRALCYLVIGDLVLPLKAAHQPGRYVATTCIPKGGLSEASRQRRNRHRSRGSKRPQHPRRTDQPRMRALSAEP